MSEILKLLQEKGVQVKDKPGEAVADCPFCQDTKKHLYVNKEKDVFFCQKCNETGNIWKLRKFYGVVIERLFTQDKPKVLIPKIKAEEYHSKLDDKAFQFLQMERGFTKETIKHFNLGLKDDYISIPYYKNGELVNFKYRHILKKEFLREAGGESSLFNQDNIDRAKDLIIVEGEFDCVASYQMGFTNVVSVSVGAGSFNPDWVDFLDSIAGKIYIAYDNDKKGSEGAEKLCQRIGYKNCYRVLLPLKDFNECMLSGITKEDISKCLSESKPYAPKSFYHATTLFSEVDDLFLNKEHCGGIKLDGWASFNGFMGGIRESEVTVITGETASGKTTFGINIFHQLAKQGKSVLIISSEVPAPKILVKMVNMESRKPFNDLTKDEYSSSVVKLSMRGIFFVKVHGKMDTKNIREYIIYARRKYDVKYILLDHLHFFVEAGSESFVSDIEKFMREMVSISFETGVSIFLIAHPGKLNNSKGLVCMNDLKGSSSIKQDSHNIIMVWRDEDAEKKGRNEVVIQFLKVRDEAGKTGAKRYTYNHKELSYEEKIDF